MQGFYPAPIFTDHPTLLAKRASNHPPNLPPIIGRRLNRSSCRSYIKVPSDHQRSGVIIYRLRPAMSPVMSPLPRGGDSGDVKTMALRAIPKL